MKRRDTIIGGALPAPGSAPAPEPNPIMRRAAPILFGTVEDLGRGRYRLVVQRDLPPVLDPSKAST